MYPNNTLAQQEIQLQPPPQQQQQSPISIPSPNTNAEASVGGGGSSSTISNNNNNTSSLEKNAAEQAQSPPNQQVSEEKRFNAQVPKILDQMNAPLNKTLPSSTTTSLGTEPENKNNWIMANHDIFNTKITNEKEHLQAIGFP